jgi:preprotein translocase subunit SecA
MSQSDDLARWQPLVHRVSGYGPPMMRWTDAELRRLRDVLSGRLADGEAVELAMAEAFAAVREAARRTESHSYSDSDIMAGAVLHSGQTAEVPDDGYNSLIAVLAIYFGVVLNERVHYVTKTAALALHSFQQAESLCVFLGLRAGLLSGIAVTLEEHRTALGADVTYGSYQQIVFAYLRNHLAQEPQQVAAFEQQLAIVDQVDSILIDKADLSLFIKGPKQPNADLYRKVARAASELKRGTHYEIDTATGKVSLSGDGLKRGASLLQAGTLEGLQAAVLRRYLEDALQARDWYRPDVDYRVAGDKIVISRESGNRLDGAPRLREGICQAIEAREGLATSAEEVVWARMTVCDYFRSYARLCGISSVAARSSAELERVYGLRTVVIPLLQPPTRVDHPELLFEKSLARFEALVRDAEQRHRGGQPVVIGAMTAEDGRLVCRMLEDQKIEYAAVLPGDEEAAAAVMAHAGRAGSVTVLIAQVARGYDIVLEPDSFSPVRSELTSSAGLAVLGAGRGRSWRSDQWLRDLAGRRGEPGESRFFLSQEDALLRGLQSRALATVPARMRRRADGAPLGAIMERLINGIQLKVEHTDFRRRLEQAAIDDVESIQRAQIYSVREEPLNKSDLSGYVSKLIDEVAAIYVRRYRDPERLLDALAQLYPTGLTIADLTMPGDRTQVGDPGPERLARIKADAHVAYHRHEQLVGTAAMRGMERRIIFPVLNSSWRQHLSELDAMRAAASPSLSPRDRLSEYRNEATKRYMAMLERIKEDIVGYLFHSEATTQ